MNTQRIQESNTVLDSFGSLDLGLRISGSGCFRTCVLTVFGRAAPTQWTSLHNADQVTFALFGYKIAVIV